MPTRITHIGELVSNDINYRFSDLTFPRVDRSSIKKVILTLPDGTVVVVPVETRVQVEYG